MTTDGDLRPSARLVDGVIDRALLPDPLLRAAIRRLLRSRARAVVAGGPAARSARRAALLAELSEGPVTVATAEANRQHYEVPTELFERMLGPRLKYSSAWWPEGVTDLAAAELAMLERTAAAALLEDGQDVLELGCGWGSLTLWMAEQHPRSRIVAVSNSTTQREHIEASARRRGLDNVTVRTGDVARLGVDEHTDVVGEGRFDRVVSVEMFEHVRNHRELGRRIAGWLRPEGRLFVHVFAHRSDPYLFETGVRGDWMARNFFTGGMMPSHDWLPDAIDALEPELHEWIDGTHYARTLRAWLDRLDAAAPRVLARFGEDLDARRSRAELARWRTFTIACEELFAHDEGAEWGVTHLRFRRPTVGQGGR
jgi:cyclopropane-fatty-acyl-phospholipid synthase